MASTHPNPIDSGRPVTYGQFCEAVEAAGLIAEGNPWCIVGESRVYVKPTSDNIYGIAAFAPLTDQWLAVSLPKAIAAAGPPLPPRPNELSESLQTLLDAAVVAFERDQRRIGDCTERDLSTMIELRRAIDSARDALCQALTG